MIDPDQACQLCRGAGACYIQLTVDSRLAVTCPAYQGSGRLDDAVAKTLAGDEEYFQLLSAFSASLKLQETERERLGPEDHPPLADPNQEAPQAASLKGLLRNLYLFGEC